MVGPVLQLEECRRVALAVQKAPRIGGVEMVGEQVPSSGRKIDEGTKTVSERRMSTTKSPPSPLTARDFGTDDVGSPLEEESPDANGAARDWGRSRLAGARGRARLAAAGPAATL